MLSFRCIVHVATSIYRDEWRRHQGLLAWPSTRIRGWKTPSKSRMYRGESRPLRTDEIQSSLLAGRRDRRASLPNYRVKPIVLSSVLLLQRPGNRPATSSRMDCFCGKFDGFLASISIAFSFDGFRRERMLGGECGCLATDFSFLFPETFACFVTANDRDDSG